MEEHDNKISFKDFYTTYIEGSHDAEVRLFKAGTLRKLIKKNEEELKEDGIIGIVKVIRNTRMSIIKPKSLYDFIINERGGD